MTRAIRGAVQLNRDSREEMTAKVKLLVDQMMSENSLLREDVISIIFTVTGDLRAMNPAAALRNGGAFKYTPLFCAREPEISGALPRIVRVLMHAETESSKQDIRHIYSGGAERLRPDLN